MCERRNNRNNKSYLNVVDVIPHLAVAIDKKGDKDAGKNRNNKLLAIVINVIPNLCSQKQQTKLFKSNTMDQIQNTEAMVQDQNLTHAPETGAEQNETSESMESKEQIPGVQPLRDAIEGESQAAEVPATESPAVESEAEPTPESPAEEDGTTDAPTEEEIEAEREARRAAILEDLAAGKKVQLRDFRSAGFTFADMDDSLQRKETKKDSRQLMESLKTAKQFYRAIEILPVSTLMEAGHPCFKLDGKPITAEDPLFNRSFVRTDGKQRSIAYARLMSDPNFKGKEAEYSVPLVLCSCKVEEIETYVREIQTAAVWDEKTKRQTVMAKLGGEESGLTLMNTFMNEVGMTARASYKLIYRREGYKKDLYEDSMRNNTLADGLKASKAIIERAKHDYECLRIAFRNNPNFLKSSMAPDAIINVYTDPDGGDPVAAANDFLTFLKSLQAEDFKKLDEYSSVSEKKTALLAMYATHKKTLSTDPGYAALVEERVETATKEYKKKVKEQADAEKTKSPKSSIEENYYAVV